MGKERLPKKIKLNWKKEERERERERPEETHIYGLHDDMKEEITPVNL